ncbi:MAG: AraC family transcriptional regulator [Solobacterium sp.]|nr:AraC family transcriptional regulator [Solobacterium sp.]
MNDIVYVGKHPLTYYVPKHMHNYCELIYCTSGSGELQFANRTLKYSEDSLAVIPPMTMHTNSGNDGFTNIHCVISDMSLNIQEPIVISGLKNGHLRNAFSALFYYYSLDRQAQSALIPIYAQLIVASIETMISTETSFNDIVRQISDTIAKNYVDPNFDLNQYLVSFSFSTEYLKRIFRQEMGMTPRQYLTEIRLENAAKILSLENPGLNISQVSRQCGFNDPLYFSKLFKRKYGVSPKNYINDDPVPGDSDSTKIYQ